MGVVVPLTLLLIGGAVVSVSVVLLRRRAGMPRPGSGLAGLDAEVEANRWVVRLGGSLAGLRPGDDEAAAQALALAAGRHRTARGQLADARTPAEYALARQTAAEGLRYVGVARSALGLGLEYGSAGDASGSGSDSGSGSGNSGTARRLRGAHGRFGVTAGR